MNNKVKLTLSGAITGVIVLTLNAEKAPISTANFLMHVKGGFYNNTLFHRVIPGFMAQGGGFDEEFNQKSGAGPIQNEATNGLKNTKYSVAMARTSDPHSASSQFFINVADNHFLNHTTQTPQGWGYAVFGEVTEGKEVVDELMKVRTGRKGFHDDVPREAIVMRAEVLADSDPI